MPYAYTKDSYYDTYYDTNRGLINAILTNDKMAEEEKSELIANVMNEFKVEYPELKYHATKQDVTETELRLTKEIEETRKEIKELDLKLTKEIKELDLKLTKEIKESKTETVKWVAGMMFAQVVAIAGLFFTAFKLFSQ